MGLTATYIDASTFTVDADKTDVFTENRRVKANCDIDGNKYSHVVSSSYNGSETTVNINDSVLTSNLIEVWFGIVSSGITGATPIHDHTSDEEGGILDIGGGFGLPQIIPISCSLDDIDDYSSKGSAFGMIETIDFAPSGDGAIWFTFHFPDSLDDTKDINLLAYYNLSDADDSTIIRFNTYYWSKGVGEMPDSTTPDGTNTDDISTGTGEEESIRDESLTVIPSSVIALNDVVTLKFQREGSNANDTYSGTFQLLYIFPYQS